MSIINCRAIYYTYGTSGKNYKEAHNFRVSVDENARRNLKMFKETIL